jgi:hypothetical protein
MVLEKRVPFRNMSPTQWENLGLAALFIFYLIQTGFDLLWHNTCGHLAIDYCAFWSAGRVANMSGYADVYNLDALKQIQFEIAPRSANLSTFVVSPIAYFPVFVIPFQFLSLLPPFSGFVLWTSINLTALFFYLRFFIQKTTGQILRTRLLALVFLSLPVYWNFFNGQVNVWLVLCVGEFMRAVMDKKPFQAGLWLAGLLLKPQTLFLIGVVLLLQRSVKVLAGLTVTFAALLGASFALIGYDGLQHLVRLWLGFTSGLPTNDVEIMMNWRMIGLHLGNLSFPLLGWIVTGLGMAATLLVVVYLWKKPLIFVSTDFVVNLLGLLAATGLFAWHSHIHTAMMLIPPLLYLIVRKEMSSKIFVYWLFVPAAIYVIAFLLAPLIQVNILPAVTSELLDFLRGASGFGVNVLLLVWTMKKLSKVHLAVGISS